MSYKILYITPHLSTGGCPQYLLKKLRLLNDIHDLYCVEYNDYGEWFVVQKNQVRELLKDRYFVLGDNKEQLLSIIDKVQPDIIHLEEMPEYYMSDDIASKVYVNTRSYNIVETSHDSSFNTASKRFFPDRFVFVSNFQKQQMNSLKIDSHVVEYPIVHKDRVGNRDKALVSLGLDPNLLHVVNVGLWSPRKNQGEIVEYAKKMIDLPVQFHFIGNTAGNFESYWSPILKNLPSNCRVWGERSDVDTFYSSMDLFLFTSRGNDNDKETSPIVIREAISYKLPSLIYNLPVYLNMYDRYSNIKYLSNDLDNNVDIIRSYILKKNIIPDYSYIVSTYPTTSVSFITTVQCLRSLTNAHRILTTHHSSYEKFRNIADTVVYDERNPIIKHTYYCKAWWNTDRYKCDINLKANDNDNYHGLAVWTNYQNGIRKSKELGYRYSVCLNYDIVLNDKDLLVVEDIVNKLRISSSKGFFIHEVLGEGDTLKTVFFVIDNDYFIEKFESVYTELGYNASIVKHDSPSNSLENYTYHVLKNNLNDLIITKKNESELFPHSSLNAFSCVEYFTVVPNDEFTKFYIWKSSSNLIDNKNVIIRVYENRVCILKIGYVQLSNRNFYQVVNVKPGCVYDVTLEEYNSDSEYINSKKITVSNIRDIDQNGRFLLHGKSVIPSNAINLHHINCNDVNLDYITELSVWGVTYRSYSHQSELDVVRQLENYDNEINVIIKDVSLCTSPDQFVQYVRKTHSHMLTNNVLLTSLNPKNDKPSIAYVINSNMIRRFKTIDSIDEFNSYIKVGSPHYNFKSL